MEVGLEAEVGIGGESGDGGDRGAPERVSELLLYKESANQSDRKSVV